MLDKASLEIFCDSHYISEWGRTLVTIEVFIRAQKIAGFDKVYDAELAEEELRDIYDTELENLFISR